MNEVLEEILRTGKVKSPDGELLDAEPVSIPEEKGEFLQKIINDLRPASTLEVGLAYGVSTLFICDALKDENNRHIVIDPSQQESWKNIGLNNLRNAGYEKMIEFYALPSYRALPQLEAQGRRLDFAFIDGWHTFDYALVDFFFIDRMLKVGGIVVLDDTDWTAIRKLCRYIATNHAYKPICMDEVPVDEEFPENFNPAVSPNLANGIKQEQAQTDRQLGLWGECIAFRKESDDTRLWDFFVPF